VTGAGGVDIDTTALVAATKKLEQGLDSGGKAGARLQADTTARDIAQAVPRRSGRLAGSVRVVADGDGFGVSYGEGIPYASYIERRSGAVDQAVAGADERFARAMLALAGVQVGRL
jgi:Flp pilus assembly protein TadG